MMPQITAFYGTRAFNNSMFLLRALPQVALETLNPLCLRAHLRRDCGQWGRGDSTAFHLHQIYGSASDKNTIADATNKDEALLLLPLFSANDAVRGITHL